MLAHAVVGDSHVSVVGVGWCAVGLLGQCSVGPAGGISAQAAARIEVVVQQQNSDTIVIVQNVHVLSLLRAMCLARSRAACQICSLEPEHVVQCEA